MITVPSELRRAVDVANNVARQCGFKYRINAEVQYHVEFPNGDFRQYDSEQSAVDAIVTFNANAAQNEAMRRLKLVVGDPNSLTSDEYQILEAEVDLIIERAQ